MTHAQPNKSAFNPFVKRYILTNSQGTLEIVFFPKAVNLELGGPLGVPQLRYRDAERELIFTGDEIRQQQSLLGLLVTVVLQPDADVGQLNLTLVLPPINLAEHKAQRFETIAIKTRSQGHIIDPGGATLHYETLMLQGVAQAIVLPLTAAESESLELTIDHPTDREKQPVQQVQEITEMNVAILESFPIQLQVSLSGTVPSAGWSNPQLIPYTYIQAPPDGIYDFDFVATPPSSTSVLVITPIQLQTILFQTEGMKGIRVHAALNSKEFLLDPEPSCPEVQAL